MLRRGYHRLCLRRLLRQCCQVPGNGPTARHCVVGRRFKISVTQQIPARGCTRYRFGTSCACANPANVRKTTPSKTTAAWRPMSIKPATDNRAEKSTVFQGFLRMVTKKWPFPGGRKIPATKSSQIFPTDLTVILPRDFSCCTGAVSR